MMATDFWENAVTDIDMFEEEVLAGRVGEIYDRDVNALACMTLLAEVPGGMQDKKWRKFVYELVAPSKGLSLTKTLPKLLEFRGWAASRLIEQDRVRLEVEERAKIASDGLTAPDDEIPF